MILFEENWLGAALRILISFGAVFGVFVYILVYGERKISAFIQDRVGPNRVGPFGLLQGLADGVKFIFKENIRPKDAHPFLFYVAPWAAVFPAVLAFAAVPFGAHRVDGRLIPLVVADIDVGVLFTISVASLGVFSLILGGWASNSKYPLLGGLRAAAQMISYEIPLGLAILAVVVLSGSLHLSDIVLAQQREWFILWSPLGFLLFTTAVFAETNRLPFDMPEGETEIIGYHSEYAGMKFAMFFMAEYANMFTASCLTVLLFLGGWELLPFYSWDRFGQVLGIDIYADSILWILPTLWFVFKVLGFLFFFIWVRWTLPRFRYDQLMKLGWQRLIPIGLINLLVTVALAPRFFL